MRADVYANDKSVGNFLQPENTEKQMFLNRYIKNTFEKSMLYILHAIWCALPNGDFIEMAKVFFVFEWYYRVLVKHFITFVCLTCRIDECFNSAFVVLLATGSLCVV